MTRPTLEFIGTATTLLRLGAFTVLTDPNFLHRGQRAYLGKGLFSKRLTEPSLQPAQLPELDAVVLSHLHGDHFDRVARRELSRQVPVYTTPPAGDRLQSWGFEVVGLDRWESVSLHRSRERLTITAVPGEHAPKPLRALLPPVMGSVLEHTPDVGRPFRLYVTGDTLYRPWLEEIGDRFGPLDAMAIHLGGTRIAGVLVTMDADQGADLTELLAPAVTVPIHVDDYGVFTSPLSDFERVWCERGLPGQLRTVGRGVTMPLDGASDGNL